MSDYLLDTNILRYWYDTGCPEHAKVLANVRAVRHPDPQTQYVPRLFVSVITVGEIEYGHRYAPTPNVSDQLKYCAFVRQQCPAPLEIITHVSRYYGELKAWLMGNFCPKTMRTRATRLKQLVDPATTEQQLHVQENDVWIAAQAMTFNLVLVTHDSRGNFGRLQRQFTPELRVEDWAR